MSKLYRGWRRLRDQAGELLGYVAKAVRVGRGEKVRKPA